MQYCLSGIKTLTLKLQVPSKTWCEGRSFIGCLLCSNENADGDVSFVCSNHFNLDENEWQGYEQVLLVFHHFLR